MHEKLNIITERVDDIPLLLTQMDRMGLAALLDAHFPTHGNWQGLAFGRVATIWLSSILSRGDHRLVPGGPRGGRTASFRQQATGGGGGGAECGGGRGPSGRRACGE